MKTDFSVAVATAVAVTEAASVTGLDVEEMGMHLVPKDEVTAAGRQLHVGPQCCLSKRG